VQALADISRSALYAFVVYKAKLTYVCAVVATKPMQRLHGFYCYDSIAPNAKYKRVLCARSMPG